MRGVRFNSLVVLAVVGVATGVGFGLRMRSLAPKAPDYGPLETADPKAPRPPDSHEVALPGRNVVEIIVLTDQPAAQIDRALAAPAEFADSKICEAPETCQALAAFLKTDAFRTERRPRSEVQLPSAEVIDELAPTLSRADRVRALNATWAVTIHAGAPRDDANLPLRAVFAAGAVLGLGDSLAPHPATWVYDVVNRRIESGSEFARRASLPSPLTADLLRPDLLYIHRYDDPDPEAGGATQTRLLTLGMKAFALPDLTIGPCDPADAPALAGLLHDVEAKLEAASDTNVGAHPTVAAPLWIGHVAVDLRPAPRRQGDPENLLYWVVPNKASDPTPADYAVLARSMASQASQTQGDTSPTGATGATGATGDPLSEEDDQAVAKVTAHAVATFPQAFAAWKKSPGATLQVAAPFRNEEADAADQRREFMWVTIDSADAVDGKRQQLTGRLANQPYIVKSLTAGSTVHVAQSKIYDWILQLPDGTTTQSKTADAGH